MKNSAAISVSRSPEGVATLSFRGASSQDVVLSIDVLAELQKRLAELEADRTIIGLILTTADAHTRLVGPGGQAARWSADDVRSSQALVRRLSTSRLATLAAMQGAWLGAAVELAAWCDGRLVTTSAFTRLAPGQIQCGLTPMWGGAAILPRRIGVRAAFDWLTTQAPVSMQEAVEVHFAELVAPELLADTCRDWLLRHIQSGNLQAHRKAIAQPLTFGCQDRATTRRQALDSIRSMPTERRLAAAAVLELILDSCSLSLEAGCDLAAHRWQGLAGQMPARALLNVASLAEMIRHDEGATAPNEQRQPVQQVGVLGAGIMGEGIAAVNLRHGVPVVMQDASSDALDRCFQSLQATSVAAAGARSGWANVSMANSDGELRPCDLLIESIVENKDVKQRVLERLSPQLGAEAVLASNTSTIPISQLARSVVHPQRFCGIHFCNPVERMPLVEVVRGELTSDATVRRVVQYAKQIGKLPIVVNDCPGFLINRLLLLYMNEALTLYCEGVPLEQIERVAMRFGMECGPFELFDVIGVDTAMYGGKLLWEAFPERISLTPVLPAMVKRSWLGKKQGRGFYRYEADGRRGEVDAELQRILEAYVRPAGSRSDQQVLDRLLLAVLLEATRILEDGIVRDVRDVDAGLVFGLGFPRRCGGLLFWADGIGAPQLLRMLQPLATLGPRMQPTQLLISMAQTDTRFYELEGINPCAG